MLCAVSCRAVLRAALGLSPGRYRSCFDSESFQIARREGAGRQKENCYFAVLFRGTSCAGTICRFDERAQRLPTNPRQVEIGLDNRNK